GGPAVAVAVAQAVRAMLLEASLASGRGSWISATLGYQHLGRRRGGSWGGGGCRRRLVIHSIRVSSERAIRRSLPVGLDSRTPLICSHCPTRGANCCSPYLIRMVWIY